MKEKAITYLISICYCLQLIIFQAPGPVYSAEVSHIPQKATLSAKLTEQLPDDLFSPKPLYGIQPNENTRAIMVRSWQDQNFASFNEEKLEKVPDNTLAEHPGWNETGKLTIIKKHFPDGEIYLRALNPASLQGQDLQLAIDLKDPEALLTVLFTLDILNRFGARSLEIILEDYAIENEQDSKELILQLDLLHAMAAISENVVVRFFQRKDGKSATINYKPITFDKNENLEREGIKSVVYLNERFRNLASGISRLLYDATVTSVDQGEFFDQNLLLVHSMTSTREINSLLKSLVNLRLNNAKGITLHSTYLGYARQDRFFQDKEGAAISRDALVKLVDYYTDKIASVSIHGATHTGLFEIANVSVTNLNGFPELAKYQFSLIVRGIIQRLHLQTKDGSKVFVTDKDQAKLQEALYREFEKHPLILLGPDKGSAIPIYEAARVLQEFISDPNNYGVDIPVHVAFLPKARQSERQVNIQPTLLTFPNADEYTIEGLAKRVAEGRLEPVPWADFNPDSWIFLLDDEISTGGTIKKAVYVLVNKLGFEWGKIFTSFVQGKFADALREFLPSVLTDRDLLYHSAAFGLQPPPYHKDEEFLPRVITFSEAYRQSQSKDPDELAILNEIMHVNLRWLFKHGIRRQFPGFPIQESQTAKSEMIYLTAA